MPQSSKACKRFFTVCILLAGYERASHVSTKIPSYVRVSLHCLFVFAPGHTYTYTDTRACVHTYMQIYVHTRIQIHV